MKKINLKIGISAFTLGIIVLSIGLFANRSSDLAILNNTENQVANVSGFLDNPKAGDLAQDATESNKLEYTSISGVNFEAGSVGDGEKSDFVGLLRTIFNWSIAIVIIVATISVIFGAVQYMTTDAFSGKTSGRERMTSAIGGLILALISWLILFTINGNILSSNFLDRFKGVEQKSSSEEGPAAVAETPEEKATRLESEINQLEQQSSYMSDQIDLFNNIKNNCFDGDGNFVKTPENTDLCGGASGTISFLGIDLETDGFNPVSFTSQEAIDDVIEDTTEKISNIEQQISDLEAEKNSIGGVSTTSNNADDEITFLSDLLDLDRFNVDNSTNNNDNGSTNDNDTTIDIDPGNNNDNGSTNDNDTTNDIDPGNEDPPRDNLTDRQVIDLAYQELIDKNIFISNKTIDMTQASNELNDALLVFRNSCCSGTAKIGDEVIFKNVFNVSDVYVDNNSFLLEKSEMNKFRIGGQNSWDVTNNFTKNNTYPDQNLVDVSVYNRCIENSSRSRVNCGTPPDNVRPLVEDYDSVNEKGVVVSDLLPNREYLNNSSGTDFKVIYNNNSWLIKVS